MGFEVKIGRDGGIYSHNDQFVKRFESRFMVFV
jgi:hypothetical protein